jgi:hypothetical protein
MSFHESFGRPATHPSRSSWISEVAPSRSSASSTAWNAGRPLNPARGRQSVDDTRRQAALEGPQDAIHRQRVLHDEQIDKLDTWTEAHQIARVLKASQTVRQLDTFLAWRAVPLVLSSS